MARKCEFTGKGPATGNQVSHSNIKTRTRWLPNLKDKKYTIPELGETLRLRLSTRAIRTIDKQGGISNAIRQAKLADLSPRLQSIQIRLRKKAKAVQ
ncbi:MAG: 50S ribosomal protein L28 [Oligoflexia bacterium]